MPSGQVAQGRQADSPSAFEGNRRTIAFCPSRASWTSTPWRIQPSTKLAATRIAHSRDPSGADPVWEGGAGVEDDQNLGDSARLDFADDELPMPRSLGPVDAAE